MGVSAYEQLDEFGDTWVLLRPLVDPDGIPGAVRMRRALKALLRGYGIRVERITGPAGGPPTINVEECNVAKKQTLLWFAGVSEPIDQGALATCAFLVREDDPPEFGRFIHSWSHVVQKADSVPAYDAWRHEYTERATVHGLGHGLKFLIEQERTERPLVICTDVSNLATRLAFTPEAAQAAGDTRSMARVRQLLGRFQWTIELIRRIENPADELARAAWESAAGRPFPGRPTRRRRPRPVRR